MSSGETANNSNACTDFKRKRNFTDQEKLFLVELVQQHQQIITSKDNKSSMKILKDKVWGEIHQQFNDNNISNLNNSTRTLDQLKKCWENLRTKAKREYKQLNIANSMEENNLQHKIISIIGDELDHSQNQPTFEFGDSFAIDYETDFNLIGQLNQNLQETTQQLANKPQMRQILVNKLISKQQQQHQDEMNDEFNGNESLIDEYRMNNKKNSIIGKQQLIVEGKLVNNPEDIVIENENDLGDDLNGDELLDEDEDLIEEIEEEIGYDEELQYDEEADLEDDVDEIVYEEDGMLTSVVRNKQSGQNSKQQSFVNNSNGNVKRLKTNNNSTIEDGHSSSNHSNSVNNYKYSPQNNKKFGTITYNNNSIRNYSNGMLSNKTIFNKNINSKLMNNNNLNETLSDLKLREQRTRLRMARLELVANRRRAQLELELAMARLENERRKKQLLERQLENEQVKHRLYRKKIEKN